MKNLLLTTTALATLAAGAAFAGGNGAADSGLEIKLGGELDAQMGFRSQKSEYTQATGKGIYTARTTSASDYGTETFKRGVTPGNNSVGLDTVAAVHATIKNKTASGLVYGANVGVQTTTRSTSSAGKHLTDRTYLFMENDMGRVELGTNESAANAMRLGGDRVARATGGIDGDWNKYVALDTFGATTGANAFQFTKVRAANFITSPGLVLEGVEAGGSPVNTFLAGDEKSRKITYYTPEFNGFQAGLSYIPDTRNSGQDQIDQLGVYMSDASASYGQYYNVTVKNALSGGLSWHGTIDKMHNVEVSLVGESGKTVAPGTFPASYGAYNNVSAYALGAKWNYKEFALAASYGHTGKSLVNKTDTNGTADKNSFKDGKYWTLGAGWAQGPWGASVTYMSSEKNKNKFSLVSLGADYELAPGLMPYAEVSMFNMKQKNDYWSPLVSRSDVTTTAGDTVAAAGGNYTNTNYKNKGTALILGTKINF